MKSIAKKLFYSYIEKTKYKYISISFPLGYKSLNIDPIRHQPSELQIKPKGKYPETF